MQFLYRPFRFLSCTNLYEYRKKELDRQLAIFGYVTTCTFKSVRIIEARKVKEKLRPGYIPPSRLP